MAQPITAFFLAAGAGTLNAVTAYNRKPSAGAVYTPVLAGIVLGAVCVALNNASGTDIGTYLAAAVMLATILSTGPSLTKMILAVTGVER